MKENNGDSDKSRGLFKNGFDLHSFVFIFSFLIIAVLLTYVVPAGQFDRVVNDMGQEVVVPGTYRQVEQSPVSLPGMFVSVVTAFREQADVIFCILFAYCFMGVLIRAGVFDVIIKIAIRKLKHRVQLIFPVITLLFALMGSVAGLAEETFGFFPVCICLAVALGYDEIVGGSIVYLAVFTGFASATFNPYTIGVAQSIAEVPMYSGLGYRVICFVLFYVLLITYIMVYAKKIKADPRKSLMYDEKRLQEKMNEADIASARLSLSQWLNLALLLVVLVAIVAGAMLEGWYIAEISALFLAATILAGFIAGLKPNEIANHFVSCGGETMFSLLAIGLSNAICVVMNTGRITDTVVYAAAAMLKNTSGAIGAVAMLLVQNLLNFFIPSGPGQAAVTMPIMTPLADLVGVSRQTAVLAFQFGDGYSNIFWPTMVFMMCGIMKIPVKKWYKFMAPLFGLMFALQVVLIVVAVAIGY